MAIITRKEALTDDRHGYYFDKRPIPELLENGIINCNKPQGPTSHQISNYVKIITKAKKAGHSGTLDPNVTGVLPIGINNATKAITYLLSAGKEYVANMLLHSDVDETKIRDSIKYFLGEIEQMVPLRSNVKRQLRKRNIYELEIYEIKNRNVLFRMKCQAGTYVRKFIHDWGLYLKTKANMQELIRVKVGYFTTENMTNLQELTDAMHYYIHNKNEEPLRKIVYPIEYALWHNKKIFVMDTAVGSLCQGAKLKVPGISKLDDDIKVNDLVLVLTLKGEIIGVGNAKMTSEDIYTQGTGEAIKMSRIIMKNCPYPKIPKR